MSKRKTQRNHAIIYINKIEMFKFNPKEQLEAMMSAALRSADLDGDGLNIKRVQLALLKVQIETQIDIRDVLLDISQSLDSIVGALRDDGVVIRK